MSREIIHRNHDNLVQVLTRVRNTVHDGTANRMASTMLDTILGCATTRLVGVSVDRGLPFVGYAGAKCDLYDVARRKVAPIGRFYKLYIDGDVTQGQRDVFERYVVTAAKSLGFYCPNEAYDKSVGVRPARQAPPAPQRWTPPVRRDECHGDW